MKLSTLSALANLETEMALAGRASEATALAEARRLLTRPRHGLLTTGQAAERLGVSIPTVKRWIERGALDGARVEGRWLVTSESVERVAGVREALDELAREGFPTDDELADLFARSRHLSPSSDQSA